MQTERKNKTATKPATEFTPEKTQDILARTLWGEARGEGESGMEAVACVVLNRAAKPGWWGRCVASVCLKPWQFSCWNLADPNRDQLRRVTEKDPSFRLARAIAARALAGEIADMTGQATHYHARGIIPGWAEGRRPSAVIGKHIFYNDVA